MGIIRKGCFVSDVYWSIPLSDITRKMFIKVTLRANLSNGNWIFSFRYEFLHRCILRNCFICGLFHFCCMIWLNWRTSGNHFYIASLETKHSCSNLWKHTELRKTDFFQYHWIQNLIVIFILQPSNHMWFTEYYILLSAKSHYGARQFPLDCDITVDLEKGRFKTVLSTDTDGLTRRQVGGIHDASCLELNDRLSWTNLSFNLK